MTNPRPKPSREAILAVANKIKSWNPQLWQNLVEVLRHVDDWEEEEFMEKLLAIQTKVGVHLVRSGYADGANERQLTHYVETIVRMENGIEIHNPALFLPD